MGQKASPAVPFLIDMLYDSALLGWDTTPWIPGLRVTASTTPGNLAADALAQIHDLAAIEPLTDLLRDERVQERERSNAAHALLEMRDLKAAEALIGVATDKSGNGRVRYSVLRELGKLKSERVVDVLIQVSADPNEDATIRGASLVGLGESGNARALDPLLRALPVDEVNYDAATGLERLARAGIKDLRAMEGLIEMLGSTRPEKRLFASWALRAIADGGPPGEDQTAWRRYWMELKQRKKR